MTHPPTPTRQGTTVHGDDAESLRRAVDDAVDYRGDVTITRRSTGESIEGYVFDRRADRAGGDVLVRIIPKDSSEKVAVPLRDIAALTFTGRDTASGKSFENWVKKYVQKKLAGEAANIESEPLNDA